MNIGPSRIGRQESAAMVGVSLFTATVFAMDSQQAYSGGNSTYIWMPLSILVSLAAVMVIMLAMEKSGADTLDKLFTAAFGRVVGRIAYFTVYRKRVLHTYRLCEHDTQLCVLQFRILGDSAVGAAHVAFAQLYGS